MVADGAAVGRAGSAGTAATEGDGGLVAAAREAAARSAARAAVPKERGPRVGAAAEEEA